MLLICKKPPNSLTTILRSNNTSVTNKYTCRTLRTFRQLCLQWRLVRSLTTVTMYMLYYQTSGHDNPQRHGQKVPGLMLLFNVTARQQTHHMKHWCHAKAESQWPLNTCTQYHYVLWNPRWSQYFYTVHTMKPLMVYRFFFLSHYIIWNP